MKKEKSNNTVLTRNLKSIRTSKGLYQKDVALALSIPVSTYSNWEQGRTEPSVQDILNLIKFFGIEANDLFVD